MENIQTGNPILLTNVQDLGHVYLEQHQKITIQAHVDTEGTYTAFAFDIFEGRLGEVTDCACIDDALAELDTHYSFMLKGWHPPQTLGV